MRVQLGPSHCVVTQHLLVGQGWERIRGRLSPFPLPLGRFCAHPLADREAQLVYEVHTVGIRSTSEEKSFSPHWDIKGRTQSYGKRASAASSPGASAWDTQLAIELLLPLRRAPLAALVLLVAALVEGFTPPSSLLRRHSYQRAPGARTVLLPPKTPAAVGPKLSSMGSSRSRVSTASKAATREMGRLDSKQDAPAQELAYSAALGVAEGADSRLELLIRQYKVFSTAFALYLSYKRVQWKTDQMKEGTDEEQEALWDAAHERNSRRLYKAFVSLEGFWVKCGQFLSSRADVLPKQYTALLSKCQDALPARPWSQIRSRVQQELGRPLDEIFESVEEQPIACASIAQVHRAVLKGGQQVVVKVQHKAVAKRLLQVSDQPDFVILQAAPCLLAAVVSERACSHSLHRTCGISRRSGTSYDGSTRTLTSRRSSASGPSRSRTSSISRSLPPCRSLPSTSATTRKRVARGSAAWHT